MTSSGSLEKDPSPSSRHQNLWNIGIVALLLSSLALVFTKTFADPDLWGHLRFGLDAIQAGKIVQVDQYSYVTAGQRWINHEWLAEVLFGISWLWGRASGLIILKMIIGLLTVGVILWHLLRDCLLSVRQAVLVATFGLSLLFLFFVNIRPQIFSYLFFAILLIAIMRAEQARYGWLWSLPLIMWLWVNSHGGVLAGLGLLAFWTALHLIFDRPRLRKIVLPVLACLAVTLLNPYGPDLLTFLVRTGTVSRPEIGDWQPVRIASILGIWYLVEFVAFATAIGLSSRLRRPVPLVLFGAIALLPLLAIRHLPLFAIGAVILTGEHAGGAWDRFFPPGPPKELPSRLAASLPLATAVLILFGAILVPRQIVIDEAFPVAAAQLLKESGVSGNLANDFGFGEYLIWHLGPRIKVSMDGRRETLYSPASYDEYLDFMRGRNDWAALLRTHRTDMALVPVNAADYNLLKLSPGWLLVYEDPEYAIFVNRQSSLMIPLQRAAATFVPPIASHQFP